MKKLFKISLFLGYMIHLLWIFYVLTYGKSFDSLLYHFLGLGLLGSLLIYFTTRL